jgi:hypothetical protein
MKAKSVGADDFIVKFDAKELADIVNRLALRVKGE